MRSRSIALGLPLALLLTAVPRFSADPPSLEDWIRGPVRYVAHHDEVRRFRALRTDDERALFIERFWKRRDPSPTTLINETRQVFWERVQAANAAYQSGPRPGWMTDRGKIHVLYGPPTDIETHKDLYTEGRPGGARGLIRWIYQGRPGGRRDLDPITVVAFVRETSGEYRLTREPSLSSVFFDATLEARLHTGEVPSLGGVRSGRSELAVMADLGKLQEVPPQEQVLFERVETLESYETRPLDAVVGRYEHPEADGTLVVATVDVTGFSPGGPPAILARFTPRDATAKPRLLGEGSFRAETFAEKRLAQGRIRLGPGVYDVLILVADTAGADTGIFRDTLTVTPAAGELRMSDVVLARQLEPLAYRALVSHDEPFLLGPYRVVPRVDRHLRCGETVDVHFEIYGGRPPYQVTYRISGRDLDGSWVPLGREQRLEAAAPHQAWGLTTSESWPDGEYRVLIEVRDAAGASAAAPVPFSLVAAGDE